MIGVVTASTLLAYALYTIDPETVAKFGSDTARLDRAVSALRDLSVPVSRPPERRRRQSLRHAADRPAAAGLRRALGLAVSVWSRPSALSRNQSCSTAWLNPRSRSSAPRPATVLSDYHPLMNLAGYQDVDRQGRRHRAQGQHLLALLLSRQLDHALAARRRDPRDEAGRLRPRT